MPDQVESFIGPDGELYTNLSQREQALVAAIEQARLEKPAWVKEARRRRDEELRERLLSETDRIADATGYTEICVREIVEAIFEFSEADDA